MSKSNETETESCETESYETETEIIESDEFKDDSFIDSDTLSSHEGEKEKLKKNGKRKRKNNEIIKKKSNDELIIILISKDRNQKIKENEKENKKAKIEKNKKDKKDKEEKEEEKLDIYGPFLFEKKEIKEIKFTKIFEKLDELISLGEKYDPSFNYICNINIHKLHNIVEPLKELNNMIGLEKFKRSVIDQITYILTLDNKNETPMLNSCIYGPSGVGKTSVAQILGKIYASCGILSTNKFKIVKREDFVGEYLGSTAVKTKELLESCKGGVLFLDEAYSFGSSHSSGKDMFAKEAVDTLNVFLSENYKDFVFIIAGYEEDIKNCFFCINQGLERRFPYRYTIESYNYKELTEIFKKFIKEENYTLSVDDKSLEDFFMKHKESFPFFGGDVKIFLDKCKVYHSRRMILLDKNLWKKLTIEDIKESFIIYLEERQIKEIDKPHLSMYI